VEPKVKPVTHREAWVAVLISIGGEIEVSVHKEIRNAMRRKLLQNAYQTLAALLPYNDLEDAKWSANIIQRNRNYIPLEYKLNIPLEYFTSNPDKYLQQIGEY